MLAGATDNRARTATSDRGRLGKHVQTPFSPAAHRTVTCRRISARTCPSSVTGPRDRPLMIRQGPPGSASGPRTPRWGCTGRWTQRSAYPGGRPAPPGCSRSLNTGRVGEEKPHRVPPRGVDHSVNNQPFARAPQPSVMYAASPPRWRSARSRCRRWPPSPPQIQLVPRAERGELVAETGGPAGGSSARGAWRVKRSKFIVGFRTGYHGRVHSPSAPRARRAAAGR